MKVQKGEKGISGDQYYTICSPSHTWKILDELFTAQCTWDDYNLKSIVDEYI